MMNEPMALAKDARGGVVAKAFSIDSLNPDLIEHLMPKSETVALVGRTKEVKSQKRVTKSNMSIASQNYAGAPNKAPLNLHRLSGALCTRSGT